MKRIVMLEDAKGCDDGNPEVKQFEKGKEYVVTDGLASAFSKQAKVLGDPDQDELLSTEKSETKGKVQNKSERK